MRKMLIGLVLAGLSSNVMAEWTRVSGNADLSVTMHVNLATIRQRGDMAKMWTLIDFKTVQQLGQDRYLSIEAQEEYNCREEQHRPVIMTMYSGNMGSGKPVYSSTNRPELSPVRPGTPSEAWLKIACGLLK